MVTEEEMINEMMVAESKEDYEKSARILGKIAKVYNYSCELTGDGVWILKSGRYKIEVMFDSGRGGEIPIDFDISSETIETLYMDPGKVRPIVEKCIEFMKAHKGSTQYTVTLDVEQLENLSSGDYGTVEVVIRDIHDQAEQHGYRPKVNSLPSR